MQALHHVGDAFESIAKSFDGLANCVVALKGAIQVDVCSMQCRLQRLYCDDRACLTCLWVAAIESEHQPHCSWRNSSGPDPAVWSQWCYSVGVGHHFIAWLLDSLSLPPLSRPRL